MKKILALLLIISVFFLLIPKKNDQKKIDRIPTAATTVPLPTSGNYSYYFAQINNPKTIQLIENVDNTSFSEMVQKNNCDFAINGGYFTSDNKPLGLFVVNGTKLYNAHKSDLLNSFFSITNAPVIAQVEPDDTDLALQAGPALIINTLSVPLVINPDVQSRRSVVAVTNDGHVLFIAIQGIENTFEGPTLKELPQRIQDIAQKEGVIITDAMNLDGGSSTAFYSSAHSRSEVIRVGSILCANLSR